MTRSTSLFRSAVLLAVLLSGIGCETAKSEASPAAPAPAPEVSKVAPAAPAAPAAQQSYKEAEFHVAIEGPVSGKVGDTLALTVKLDAVSGFKVNQEYPLKFQINKADGVAPEKETLVKADATYEGHTATMPLKVKLEHPGAHELSGRLSFSVCKEGDASVCLLEKRELGVTLDAS